MKTKVLISCAVTAKLICVFVFGNSDMQKSGFLMIQSVYIITKHLQETWLISSFTFYSTAKVKWIQILYLKSHPKDGGVEIQKYMASGLTRLCHCHGGFCSRNSLVVRMQNHVYCLEAMLASTLIPLTKHYFEAFLYLPSFINL